MGNLLNVRCCACGTECQDCTQPYEITGWTVKEESPSNFVYPTDTYTDCDYCHEGVSFIADEAAVGPFPGGSNNCKHRLTTTVEQCCRKIADDKFYIGTPVISPFTGLWFVKVGRVQASYRITQQHKLVVGFDNVGGDYLMSVSFETRWRIETAQICCFAETTEAMSETDFYNSSCPTTYTCEEIHTSTNRALAGMCKNRSIEVVNSYGLASATFQPSNCGDLFELAGDTRWFTLTPTNTTTTVETCDGFTYGCATPLEPDRDCLYNCSSLVKGFYPNSYRPVYGAELVTSVDGETCVELSEGQQEVWQPFPFSPSFYRWARRPAASVLAKVCQPCYSPSIQISLDGGLL